MENLQSAKKTDALLCVAVGTASHQHGLEEYAMHGGLRLCWKMAKLYWTYLHKDNRG
jgi:hypothetical protein